MCLRTRPSCPTRSSSGPARPCHTNGRPRRSLSHRRATAHGGCGGCGGCGGAGCRCCVACRPPLVRPPSGLGFARIIRLVAPTAARTDVSSRALLASRCGRDPLVSRGRPALTGGGEAVRLALVQVSAASCCNDRRDRRLKAIRRRGPDWPAPHFFNWS